MVVEEHSDHLVTDSGVHAVYWISEWPRSEVYPGFLSAILLSAGVRRATSIVAQPLTTAEAMRAVRKERVEYQTDAAHRARIGQLTDVAAEQEWADVTQRERDLIAGHGDLRYAGFVVVTARDLDTLGRGGRRSSRPPSKPAARPGYWSASRPRPSPPPPCPCAGDLRPATMNAPRTHTAALLTPTGTRRRETRRRRRETAELQRRATATPGTDAQARQQIATATATRPGCRGRGSRARPRCGPGCRSGCPRTPRRRRRWPGRTRSSPSKASAPPGVLIGTDLLSGGAFVYDPWVLYHQGVLTNPNVLLAGVIGTGKSALAKTLTTRSLAFGVRVYVPGDPKGEWTTVARQVGGVAITLGHGLTSRLNPLDAGTRPRGLTDTAWDGLVWSRRRELLGVLAETVLGPAAPAGGAHRPRHRAASDRGGGSSSRRSRSSSTTCSTPAGGHEGRRHPAPQRTAGTSATPCGASCTATSPACSTGPPPSPSTPTAPMVTLDLSRVSGNDTLLSLVMTCASAWMEAALADPDGGRRWVVYDEAWRVMRHPALIRRMQAQWKLSRAYGIANLMVIHRLSDLDAVGDAASETRALAQGLLADCSTRITYRQENDQLTGSATALGLTGTETSLLPTLGLGQGLWRIRDRAFLVAHQLTAGEAQVFDTTSRMGIEALEFTNPEGDPS